MKTKIEKRETAKGLPLIQHRVLGKCVILVKEKASGKYGLLGGGIEKKDGNKDREKNALIRELGEEIGLNEKQIEKMHELVTIETRSQIHNVFALKIGGKFHPSPNEISGFAFYPLEDKYVEERKAMRENMENYAIKAVNEFRHNHDWESYDVSDPQIDGKYFDQFHRELDALKQQVLKKN